jgi:predicted ABC-type ATPase
VPGHKKIRIFAGPNGSGKSTLFKALSKNYTTGYFINADELESKLSEQGSIDIEPTGLTVNQDDLDRFTLLPASQSLIDKAKKEGHEIKITVANNTIFGHARDTHSYEGSFIAAFVRYMMFAQNKTFSFETVMSHPSKIIEINEMVKEGYHVYLYFVCIDDPGVNVLRVDNRVQLGGHSVSAEKITDRYKRTLDLLHEALPMCYRAYLFDNSGKRPEMIAELYADAMQMKTDSPPGWFLNYVLPYYVA